MGECHGYNDDGSRCGCHEYVLAISRDAPVVVLVDTEGNEEPVGPEWWKWHLMEAAGIWIGVRPKNAETIPFHFGPEDM